MSNYETINKPHCLVKKSLLSRQILQTREESSPICSFLQNVIANDKLIIRVGFKARVGRYSEAWRCVLDRHVVKQSNNKGSLLFEFCAGQLTITSISLSEDHLDEVTGQGTGTQLTMLYCSVASCEWSSYPYNAKCRMIY